MGQIRMRIKRIIEYLVVILLMVVSIAGMLSWNTGNSFYAWNQYGEEILMWGSGVYARDSYMKAPIFIGTDICVLVVLVPMLLYAMIKGKKDESDIHKLKMMSIFGILTYYAMSLVFGVSYNRLILLYIILFGACLFMTFYYAVQIKTKCVELTSGMKWFLNLSGIALFVAWLPDMIPTIIKGTSLSLIEVYTTEITYALDIGIICPMCFLTIYLLNRKNAIGTLLLSFLFQICFVVGIMMISQTACHILAGVELTIPIILTKSGTFLLLGGFAFYFQRKIFKELKYE